MSPNAVLPEPSHRIDAFEGGHALQNNIAVRITIKVLLLMKTG